MTEKQNYYYQLLKPVIDCGEFFTSERIREKLPIEYQKENFSKILSELHKLGILERSENKRIYYKRGRKPLYKGKWSYRLKSVNSKQTSLEI